ncbi:Hypothetical protein, putative [Bodo saltans]|uniref:Uncharacterized protein n=1 Tax=Bodo saltans TaxID=75058 RepID=A0A0S4J276_BODSA|nr:Hypothetical protein, putative [Bodo saltans]|eukprot:CUG19035.1 Hypothetical protein, putative [Bodo saltans]
MGTGSSCCEGPAVAFPSRRESAKKLQRQQSLQRLSTLSPTSTQGGAGTTAAEDAWGIGVERRSTATTPTAGVFVALRPTDAVQPAFNPFLPLPPVSPGLPRSPRVVPARSRNSSATDVPPFSASGSRTNRNTQRSSIATNQYTRNPELSSLPFQPVQLLGGQRSVESAMENIRMARSGLSDDAGGMSGMSPIFTALRHNYSRSQSRVTLDAQQSSSLQASFIEQQKPQEHVQMEPETSVSL